MPTITHRTMAAGRPNDPETNEMAMPAASNNSCNTGGHTALNNRDEGAASDANQESTTLRWRCPFRRALETAQKAASETNGGSGFCARTSNAWPVAGEAKTPAPAINTTTVSGNRYR